MLAISHGAVEGNSIADYFVGHDALHYFKLVGVGLLCIYLIHAAKRNLKSQLSERTSVPDTNLLAQCERILTRGPRNCLETRLLLNVRVIIGLEGNCSNH